MGFRPGPEPRRLVRPAVLVLLLFAALWWRLPPAAPVAQRVVGAAFGTQYAVRWLGDANPETVDAAVAAVVARVNASMSTYHPDSELSRFNRSSSTDPVPVSKDLASVLLAAKEVFSASGGAFDPTVAPLVDAWGFGPKEVIDPPSREELAQLRAQVGFGRVRVGSATVAKSSPGLSVDLSAIAKGYAVDLASDALSMAGVRDHLVEIGGEVRARGTGPRGPWVVGIERPVRGSAPEVVASVKLSDRSLATSGNYRNFVVADGRTVTHILDPRTGEPVEHGLGSVSVAAEDCMRADAWATALYVLGASEGFERAESFGIAALFLTAQDDGGIEKRATSAFAPLLEPWPSKPRDGE